ncbi:aminopeptidase [Dubosiella muris]|uniref:Aminopeptidase n=1 Tax=Dubosiella muris TaxID=3038133 RepID=A0AC61R5W0_9FIRM|nr:aminopeptidase [Dubosiella muris]TGY65458.1 aminopeptidase [Dubosiella muris]
MTNAWKTYSEKEKQEVMDFNDAYIDFISKGKTERLCTKMIIELAKGFGYKNMEDVILHHETLKPQDKVYFNMMNKSVALVHIGNEPLEKGLNIVGAHIDSPRLDLKQHPLYEADGLAFFDTHYYGGIKKYQWLALPLALYGVVCLKDGTTIDVSIGDHAEDPVLCITDLLPHLAKDQMKNNASEFVEGDNLDVIVGSIPESDEEKDAVKKNVLALLNQMYGIDEEDFVSAELEIVPHGKAHSAGLDRSMVLGYGQDDRVCAYTSLIAMLEQDTLDRSAAGLFVDKEEIGSVGATGMQSRFFENMIAEILEAMGEYSDLKVRRALQNSYALSNDVCAAHDPNYPSVSSPHDNMAKFGHGLSFAKYTGSRGKGGSNDANPEFIAKLRKIFEDAHVVWQTSELGKVDQGGGGTIAYILANYGMQVIDSGVALQSMHSPFELSSKADVFEAKKAYKAFIKHCK